MPASTQPPALRAWHALVRAADPASLATLLAEDAVFFSPVVHTPQVGRHIVQRYLSAAIGLLANDAFRYTRELVEPMGAVLEFEGQLGDTYVNGVDLIRWNDAGQITEFKVMLRPLRAVQLVQQLMAGAMGHPPA